MAGRRNSPQLHVVDLTFGNVRGERMVQRSGAVRRDDEFIRENSHSNEDAVMESMRVNVLDDMRPTNADLMSYALQMNSHQIAKDLLLDEEDINFYQETSSFLTGNTGLNSGSIRRQLSDKQLFAKAVEEVERARARIIGMAMQKNAGLPRLRNNEKFDTSPMEKASSDVFSDDYSEKYESDFSADSIEKENICDCDRIPSRRISSVATDDYDDDEYELYDVDNDDGFKQAKNETRPELQFDVKDTCDNSRDQEEESESNVYHALCDLVDSDTECDSPIPADLEHEQSILKRLAEAHLRTPSRLSRDTTPIAGYFDSPSGKSKKSDVPETIVVNITENDDGDNSCRSSVLYSQLKTNDSPECFALGNENDKTIKTNASCHSNSSRFSESTQSCSRSSEAASSFDRVSTVRSRPLQAVREDAKASDNDITVEDSQLPVINDVNEAVFLSSVDNNQLPSSLVSAKATGTDELFDNSIDFLLSGGLNEWLVMNMKRNTDVALRSLRKQVDKHHIQDYASENEGDCTEKSNMIRLLEDRFSVYTEVYQRYIAEAMELKAKVNKEIGARTLAHDFADCILHTGRNSFAEQALRSDTREQCSDKKLTGEHERDEFEIKEGSEIHRSDTKAYHRQHIVGNKLTSASVQIECVSDINGGRNSRCIDGANCAKSDEWQFRQHLSPRRKLSEDKDSAEKGWSDSLRRNKNSNEVSSMSQTFDHKHEEIRRRNRKALYAAISLGDTAGRLIVEKSFSSSML